MSNLTDALAERFDDLEEIKDVSNNGCSDGVFGFIYYYETRKFFFEHEEDIEDQMESLLGSNYINEIADDCQSIKELINKIVWIIVENYCQTQVSEQEEDQ